jgi:Tol biopolymer transport system component
VLKSKIKYQISKTHSKYQKTKNILFLICVFYFLFLSFNFCEAATWLDPGLKWKTLETPHFSIHFYDEEEKIARRLAPIAEEVHEKLVSIIKHKPGLKTNVVLLDTSDHGNGWATVIPDPRMTLFLTDWSTNLNPSKHDLWLKFLFTHEYTHILHLDIIEGSAILPNLLFGRLLFPNTMEPWFIIEGLATYAETKYSQWGRGRDPRWEMIMRMDILENNLKSINQAAVNTVLWPMGHVRYLYGVEFLEYLSEKYGEDKLISLAHVYGDFAFTYGIDAAFLFLYRKSMGLLWEEWLVHARDKYQRQKEKLGEITEPKLITRTGYYNLKPKWSKDSRRIYYQQRNADSYPSLRVINRDGSHDKKIVEGSVLSNSLSLDPAGRKLLFTKSDTYKNYYTYKDLYTYDLERKRLKQLTKGQRTGDADFSPDGSKIVFVKNKLGTHSLMVMESNGSSPRLLSSFEENVQYFSPRWSPDGSRIAVAKWAPGGEQKIYLVNPETGGQERLTSGANLTSEANPCFSPGGDYLFFDSDRSGIVNLYAYHFESKRLYQITNVLGGAMMPDVSPDGRRIAYVSYSSKGYDIAVMSIDPSTWKEVRTTLIETSYDARDSKLEARSNTYEIHDYNPIPTLLPKFWLPLESLNENAIQTFIYTQGTDILGHHSYGISFNYDWAGDKPQYSLFYVNNQFLPRIAIASMDLSVPYDWDSSTLWMKEKSQQVSFSLYDNRVFYEWDRQVLSVGYEQTNITNISSIDAVTPKPSLGDIKGVFLAWRYLNARSYAKSISPEDGIDLTLRVTMNSSDLGSDYTNTNYRASLASYFPAPLKHHVLAPTLYGFYSRGDQLEQSNYSWRYLPLRGYPSTNLKGNKGILLSTEYRFPMWYPEGGFMYGYTFFDKIWGNLFFDAGGATFDQVSNLKLKRSLGLEFNLRTLFMWGYYGFTLKLGYVKALDEDGEDKFYLGFGGSLADLLWYNRDEKEEEIWPAGEMFFKK